MRKLSLLALGLLLTSCIAKVEWTDSSSRVVPPSGESGPTSVVRRSSARAGEASAPRAEAPRESVAAAADGEVFPYPVHRTTLDNGLRALVVPMPSGGLVSYWSIVRTGSRDEVEEGVTGFAHFFEHMMFRGTEKLPGDEYDRIVNGMGADANAYTTDDLTAYHMSFAAEDLPTVVEIEADRFQNLQYEEAEFKTEAGAVYGEFRKERTNPWFVLYEELLDTAYDVHTYEHTTLGFEADIARMPEQYEYSKGFFRRFYRPENVVLLVAGDVDPDATLELVRDHYAGWEPGYQAPEVPAEPEQTAQRRIVVPFEGKTLPILSLAFKGDRLRPTNRRMMAATLIGDLAFGPTSPVYEKLVLDEQRVQSLFPSFDYNRDPGLWGVFAMVKDPADVASVEGELWSAVDALRREPVSEQRLDDVRANLKYGFLSGLSTPDEVCSSLARLVAITGGLAAIEDVYATLDAVTPEDVRAAADHYLRRERSTVAVLHAEDEPLPVARAGAAPPVLMPVARDPNVALEVRFAVGSQDDPPGKEGIAALCGALLSEGGTRTRSYDEILAALFPLAGGYGVRVDKELTTVSGEVHRDNLSAFYGQFAEAVLRPGFRAEDFERLRDDAVNAIEKGLRYSSDEELGKAALTWKVYRGTPYGHLTGGTVESLRALTLEDVRAFWDEHFTADNLVFGLAGAYPEGFDERVRADLARLGEGAPPAAPPPAPAPIEGRHVVLVEKPGPSTAISFGHPIDVLRGSRDFYALWLARSWLGEHRNSVSHLYQVIRAARGMNYGDYAYIEAFPEGGFRRMPPTGVGRRSQMFEVWIRPLPEEQAVFALRAALAEVEELVEEGLTPEEFAFQRDFLRKYALHYAETTAERLGYALDDRFYGLDESHLARLQRVLDELTVEEVNAALKEHVHVDDLVIAMVTENAEEMQQRLVSDAPSPMDYGDVEKPAEVLAADERYATYPLAIRADRVEIVPVDAVFERGDRSASRH